VLPKSLFQLKELQGLYIWANRLTELPADIGELDQLWELDVSKNRLGALPESIGQLRQLQRLYLSENELSALPDSVGHIRSLREIYLHGNDQLGIPREILGARWDKSGATPADAKIVLRYYFLARGGSWPLNEAKLILIGRGEVGKTCIVNRLMRNVKRPDLFLTQKPNRSRTSTTTTTSTNRQLRNLV
jgi:internalin A